MGDKGVMAVGDDMGEGMQCSEHPYRNNPGGICAFCLQEKLGKLVSSSNGSSPFLSVPPQRSSSSSPSFRSDYGGRGGTMGPAAPTRTAGSFVAGGSGGRTKVPFLSATAAHRKKSSGSGGARKMTASSSSSAAASSVVVLKRSKSVAPRPMGGITTDSTTAADSPRKKSFWSFLYLSSSSSSTTTSASSNKRRSTSSGSDNGSRDLKQHQPQQEAAADSKAQTKTSSNVLSKEEQEAAAESPGGSQASSSSFGRKVARSRSVGCGSRSFSGDFLERISTGFGDCTLRRVESHRESNNKQSSKMVLRHHDSDEQRIKERVKCGGIFGGFGMMSSSSTYWLSAPAGSGDEDFDTGSSRIGSSTARASSAAIVRGGGGRSRSWGWAFASPMRAFRPAPSSTKSYANNNAISSINAAVIGSGSGINNGKIINGVGSGSNGKLCVTTTANPSSLLAVPVK